MIHKLMLSIKFSIHKNPNKNKIVLLSEPKIRKNILYKSKKYPLYVRLNVLNTQS